MPYAASRSTVARRTILRALFSDLGGGLLIETSLVRRGLELLHRNQPVSAVPAFSPSEAKGSDAVGSASTLDNARSDAAQQCKDRAQTMVNEARQAAERCEEQRRELVQAMDHAASAAGAGAEVS